MCAGGNILTSATFASDKPLTYMRSAPRSKNQRNLKTDLRLESVLRIEQTVLETIRTWNSVLESNRTTRARSTHRWASSGAFQPLPKPNGIFDENCANTTGRARRLRLRRSSKNAAKSNSARTPNSSAHAASPPSLASIRTTTEQLVAFDPKEKEKHEFSFST